MRARYVRVSSITQNEQRQLTRKNPNDVLYIDKISGLTPFKNRPKASELISDIENGNVTEIVVSSIDRLGRNNLDILSTLEYFNENGINVIVEDYGLSSMVKGKPNQVFTLVTSILSSIAQMERENIKERTRQGIELAKAKGVYRGRFEGAVEDENTFLGKYPALLKALKDSPTLSLRKLAKLGDVSPNTAKKVIDKLMIDGELKEESIERIKQILSKKV